MFYTPEIEQAINDIEQLITPPDRRKLNQMHTSSSLCRLLGVFFNQYTDERLREKATWAIYLLEKFSLESTRLKKSAKQENTVQAKSQKMYRGQIIKERSQNPVVNTNQQPEKIKKKPRMYRGQIIRD